MTGDVLGRHHALMHSDVGQKRLARHVAHGIDVRDGSAQVLVHKNAALFRGQADGL